MHLCRAPPWLQHLAPRLIYGQKALCSSFKFPVICCIYFNWRSWQELLESGWEGVITLLSWVCVWPKGFLIIQTKRKKKKGKIQQREKSNSHELLMIHIRLQTWCAPGGSPYASTVLTPRAAMEGTERGQCQAVLPSVPGTAVPPPQLSLAAGCTGQS